MTSTAMQTAYTPAPFPAVQSDMVFRVTYSRGKVTEVPIQTVNQASEWWCATRTAAMKKTGRVTTPVYMQILVGGVVRGHVAYNGKVYGEPVWRSGLQPIYDPAAAS